MSIIEVFDNFTIKLSKNYGKANCEVGWNWSPPPLHDFDLWYTLSGKGKMLINGKNYCIQKGSCFLVRPGDKPYATQNVDDRLKVIFIHFQLHSKDGGPSYCSYLPDRFTHIIETFYFETLLNRILEIQEKEVEWKNEESELLMKQLLLHLTRQQAEDLESDTSESKNKELVYKVISYIKESPGCRISHKDLADKINLSPNYLSKLFKRSMGISLRQYIKDARLERALYLLQETSMNVSQTSDALGYQNVHFFSKQFKERYGQPPSYFKHKVVASQIHGSKEDKQMPKQNSILE